METLLSQMKSGEIALLITFILFIASIIVAIAMGYIPNKHKQKIKELKERLIQRNKELLAVYQDLYGLIQIEDELCKEAGVSKKEARKGYNISYRSENKRIEKRLIELERQVNI